MPGIPSRPKEGVRGFRGPNSRLGPTNVDDPWGLYSLNCRYEDNEVKCRLGTYAISATDQSKGQRALAWKSPVGKAYSLLNQLSGTFASEIRFTETNSIPATAAYTAAVAFEVFDFLPWGNRVYFSSFLNPGLKGQRGFYPRYFPDPLTPTVSHQAFHAPIFSADMTLTVPTTAVAGRMTVGQHFFLVAFESKSGFISRPSPWSTDVSGGLNSTERANALGYTVAAPNQMIQVRAAPVGAFTWPTSYAYAHLLMTTVANPNRWFFAPCPPSAVIGGTGSAINFVVADSDAIVAQQEDATYLLSRFFNPVSNVSGSTFNFKFPSLRSSFLAGNRIGWIAAARDYNDLPGVYVDPPGPGVYFSDSNDPEVISPQFHFKGLPGGLEPITGGELESKIYVFGQNTTHFTVDTGGYPVTWPDFLAAGKLIGTSHPNGVSVNPKKYILVGHESGLYKLLPSGYEDRPISWNSSGEWGKIKWIDNASVNTPPFHILEDSENRLIYVQCLTTEYPNGCLYVYDYADGLSWDRVKFSIWTFTGGVGAIALIANFGDSESGQVRNQLAIYPYGTGKASLLKRPDSTTPYVDAQGERIDQQYKTCYLGQRGDKGVSFFNGMAFNADGIGSLRITAYSLGDATNKILRATDISPTNRNFQRLIGIKSEGCALHFRNGTNVGDRFRLTAEPDNPLELYTTFYGYRKRN